MILLISNTQDVTTDFVVRELVRQAIPFARLNTDEFPINGFGSVTFGKVLKTKKIIKWENREKWLDFSCVRAILYRRPVPPVPDSVISEKEIRRFCIDESYDFLRGTWFSLNCHWISHPEVIRKAEHKIYQLSVAQQLELPVPRTLVSNDPMEIKAFYDGCSHKMIVKPLYLGFINTPNNPQFIYTTTVSRVDMQDIETARFAPAIYQEKIDKLFDVRVTIVGDTVFAAKIETSSLPSTIPDWRFASIDDLKHTEYELPCKIESLCKSLVQSLGLDFGAIDLAVDRDGKHIFFEINPNGQWAWLETILGFPISKEIVDRLVSKAALH